MEEYTLSFHARDMLKERKIPEEWAWQTINNHEWQDIGGDGNIHYYKSIAEHGERILHVIVNPGVTPKKVVTVFFDRAARRKR